MDSRNRKFAIISVDVNDGDTETHCIEITNEQALMLANIAKEIKEFKPYEGDEIVKDYHHKCEHNFPTGEMYRTDLGELSASDYYVKSGLVTENDYIDFMDLVPYTEHGFHTVTEIRILAVIGEIKLI